MQRGGTWSADPPPHWNASSSAVIDGRIWLERSPWRLAGGWSVLAALFSIGFFNQLEGVDLPRLLLFFLLVDLLWGSIWGSMTVPNSVPSLEATHQRQRVWLPYLRPGSPAARLFGVDTPGILPVIGRVALPGILLALLVALALDTTLFWFTLVVVVISVAGWLHRQVALMPVVLLHSLISITLPWLSTQQIYGGGLSTASNGPLFLAALWTLHLWGANRNLNESTDRLGLVGVALAQIGISIQIVLAQTPLWLALVGVLWLPTWLAVYRNQPLRRVEAWWPLAMLLSAFAIGQSLSI